MRKIYHLGTCNTCKKVIAQVNEGQQFELQDIKTEPITADQLDWLRDRVGSYEGLFSRRARKYRSEGWAEKELGEDDYRRLILREYTFLKRPVVVVDESVFIGSSKAAVQGALDAL